MINNELLQKLYRYAYTLTDNEPDAYDLLHDVLEKYFSNNPGNLECTEAWLKTLIKNRFIDLWRRAKKIKLEPLEKIHEELIDLDLRNLEDLAILADEFDSIWKKLFDDEREILYYWAIEGFSTSEVANILGLPKGTILSKIYRLRQRLNQQGKCQTAEVVNHE